MRSETPFCQVSKLIDSSVMGLPRYEDPAGLVAGTVIMQVVSLAAVGLRFYSRRWKRQRYIVSDWLILVALVFGIGLSVIELYGVSQKAFGYPLGGTLEDPRAVNGRLNKAKHLELSFLLMGITALGFIKLSVCFLYWHLFSMVMFRRFLIAWIVIIIVWATSFVIAGLAECGSHLRALFGTPQDYLDHCGSAMPTGYAMVGSDVLTDLITLLIPIPVIVKLQMSSRTRLLTLLTFMVGALSVGASIAKAYIYIMATLGLYTEDAISILTGIGIWNLIEVQVGIIAACGPSLRAILGRLIPVEATLSVLSLLGMSKASSKNASDPLPSFVKMPESEEQLHAWEGTQGSQRTPSKGPSARTRIDEHELGPVDYPPNLSSHV